jgi:hypothetical protein
MVDSRFDEGLDGLFHPLQASEQDPVPVTLIDPINAGNRMAEEVLPLSLLIDDPGEMEIRELQIKVGKFSHFPGSKKEDPSYQSAFHLLILVKEKVLDVFVKIDGIPKVIGGKFTFPCKAFRGEKILQSILGQGFDFEVPLVCEPFQERVDKAYGNIESFREFPLAGTAVSVYFAKQSKDVEIFLIHGSTPAIPLLLVKKPFNLGAIRAQAPMAHLSPPFRVGSLFRMGILAFSHKSVQFLNSYFVQILNECQV